LTFFYHKFDHSSLIQKNGYKYSQIQVIVEELLLINQAMTKEVNFAEIFE